MHIMLNLAKSQYKREAHSSVLREDWESTLLGFHPGIIQTFKSKNKFQLYVEYVYQTSQALKTNFLTNSLACFFSMCLVASAPGKVLISLSPCRRFSSIFQVSWLPYDITSFMGLKSSHEFAVYLTFCVTVVRMRVMLFPAINLSWENWKFLYLSWAITCI